MNVANEVVSVNERLERLKKSPSFFRISDARHP